MGLTSDESGSEPCKRCTVSLCVCHCTSSRFLSPRFTPAGVVAASFVQTFWQRLTSSASCLPALGLLKCCAVRWLWKPTQACGTRKGGRVKANGHLFSNGGWELVDKWGIFYMASQRVLLGQALVTQSDQLDNILWYCHSLLASLFRIISQINCSHTRPRLRLYFWRRTQNHHNSNESPKFNSSFLRSYLHK